MRWQRLAAESVAFRNLATGRQRVQNLPDARVLVGAAAAGRFVAASLEKRYDFENPDAEDEQFVALFDSERAGPIVTAPAGKHATSFSIQPDGRVAICSDQGRLSTFSLTEPGPRDLGTCEGALSIADDRIVFRAQGGNLQVSDLSGRRETIAHLGSLQSTPPDFDGQSITYGLPRCVDGRTQILRMAATVRGTARPFVKCPAFIRSSGRVRVRAKGATGFGLGCPRGCTGFFGLRGPRYQIASGFFDRRPGRSRVRVRLDRYGRRALRRRGSLEANLTVVVYDRGGGRTRVRRSFRLRR